MNRWQCLIYPLPIEQNHAYLCIPFLCFAHSVHAADRQRTRLHVCVQYKSYKDVYMLLSQIPLCAYLPDSTDR